MPEKEHKSMRLCVSDFNEYINALSDILQKHSSPISDYVRSYIKNSSVKTMIWIQFLLQPNVGSVVVGETKSYTYVEYSVRCFSQTPKSTIHFWRHLTGMEDENFSSYTWHHIVPLRFGGEDNRYNSIPVT
ncbi:hypothetical protein ADUPG1_007705, partial [Aduncisulcus paluster]